MNVHTYAFKILNADTLEGKLLNSHVITDYENDNKVKSVNFIKPNRPQGMEFSDIQINFPKKGKLKTNEGKAIALHFFANHELLAIEMMAQALIAFPDISIKNKKTLVATIQDEQKHFSLYCSRLSEFGVKFGDYPLNSFFWSQMNKIETFEQFYSLVAITFEQANLDFAKYYGDLFRSMGDNKTADIMNTVYEDEIIHVSRGRKYLEDFLIKDQSFWEYYNLILPQNITASRAKGMIFDRDARKRAGFNVSDIDALESFTGSFEITKRRQWKN